MITLRPVAGYQWTCGHCKGQNYIQRFTPCVTCSHCGLVEDAQIESDRLACLTEQECNILILLSEGDTNKIIASKMMLAPNTIRRYVSTIYEKLNVSNRAEAASVAVNALKPIPK